MNAMRNPDWLEANQRWLTLALDALGETLDRRRTHGENDAAPDSPFSNVEAVLEELAASMSEPPALEVLCDTFGLTQFERNILLLCAGVELDGKLAGRCAAAQGQDHSIAPTFSLALAVFPDADWGALAPNAPLRRWRLIEIKQGDSLTASPLKVDERVLHYLAGVSYLDPRLENLLEPLTIHHELVASHRVLAEQIAAAWSEASGETPLSVLQLYGQDAEAKHSIAVAACASLGLATYRLGAAFVPNAPEELDAFSRLWTREAALVGSALVLDCHDLDATDTLQRGTVKRFVEATRGALVIATRTREINLRRSSLAFDVPALTRDEQHTLWQNALGSGLEESMANVSSSSPSSTSESVRFTRLRARPWDADHRSAAVRMARDWRTTCGQLAVPRRGRRWPAWLSPSSRGPPGRTW